MKNAFRFACLGLAGVAAAGVASAQSARTYVSTAGSDSDTCSLTAPCRTFAVAYSKTNPGGEIDALTSGEFGSAGMNSPLLLSTTVTIDGGPGNVATITANGTNAIAASLSGSASIVLRNLVLGNAAAPGSTSGIAVTGEGALDVENLHISHFSNGLSASCNSLGLTIKNTTVSDNASSGLRVTTATGTIFATVEGSRFIHNGGDAVMASGANLLLRDTTITQNAASGLVLGGGGYTDATVVNSSITGNGAYGVSLTGAANTVSVRMRGNFVVGNANGALSAGSNRFVSFGDNLVKGGGTFAATSTPQ